MDDQYMSPSNYTCNYYYIIYNLKTNNDQHLSQFPDKSINSEKNNTLVVNESN